MLGFKTNTSWCYRIKGNGPQVSNDVSNSGYLFLGAGN